MTSWKFGRQTPDNNLIRFVARRFPNPANMLDIGSGEGANMRELRKRKHFVYAVDKDPKAYSDVEADICEIDFKSAVFDCIYDINTLCHVENPPFEKIKNWLKPDGIFFSICPSLLAPSIVTEGKDYTRLVSGSDIREALKCFSEVKLDWWSGPDFRGNQLDSWIVEARP